MAINLKTQVAIDVELNTQFKEAQDFKLVTTAAVALADAIENIGRAHLQTEKGYKAHIKLLQAEKENLIIGSEEYLQYVKATAQAEERLKSLTKTHEAEAKALAIVNNSAALTTKEFEKSISVIDKAIQQRREHLAVLMQEAVQRAIAGQVDDEFINILDEAEKLLQQTLDLRSKLTDMLEQNTVAVNINSQAQQILNNAYKSTVNGIAAQKKALTEVFNELSDNDGVLLQVAASIRKLDEETRQFTQHLQTTYSSTEAYNKALDLMKTKTFNTTNEIDKQKNALAELLGFIQISSGAYSEVKTEIEQLTQQQKIASNEFLKGSTVLKHFLDQFAGGTNTSSLKKLKKDLDAATDDAKVKKLQTEIEKLSKPIIIGQITNVDQLKQIIEAVELLEPGKRAATNQNYLNSILQQAQARIDELANTTQNANTTIDAVLENIKTGLTDIANITPINFLDKFKNIEQVNAAISKLKALQTITPFMSFGEGEVIPTRADTTKEIQTLIAGLEELKQKMTEVVSLQEKPLTLSEELNKLKETVPPTVSAINELSNAYTQLLNKVSVQAEGLELFTIAEDEINNIREIQHRIEESAFAAQKLKGEFAEIFVGLKGEQGFTGLDNLLYIADQAKSVNELQLALSRLQTVQSNLSYIPNDEKLYKYLTK